MILPAYSSFATGGTREADRQIVLAHARDLNVEVCEMPTILRYLIEHTPTNVSGGSESEHVIRLMKVYELVAPE
jgi:hypothetical protein